MQPAPIDPYAPPGETRGATELGTPAPLRVDGAFGRAFDAMKRFLFRPFNLGKLFVYAFIVWLAELGEGSSFPSNFGNSSSGSGGGGGTAKFDELMEEARDWVLANLGLVIGLGVGVLALVSALTFLLGWLSSRGHMMALRSVALDHARLGEHWRETREAAWSYFGFRALLWAIQVPVTLAALAWMFVALFDIVPGSPDVWEILRALIGPILLVLVVSLFIAPVQFLGRNLLAPMLLKFGDGLRPCWRRTMLVVRSSSGGVLLFMLVRIGIAIVQGIGETLAIYLTCCIGALPVIHQLVAAPFTLFERAYTLAVLESLGPEYKLMIDATPWPPPYAPMPYSQYPQYPPQYPSQYPQQPYGPPSGGAPPRPPGES